MRRLPQPATSHINYLTENMAAVELQMAQMMTGFESLEINTSDILVQAERILSTEGIDDTVEASAREIKGAAGKVLKVLEMVA